MTDAQQALAQVREALAAGPTPGPWQKATDWSRAAVIQSTKPFKRVVCTGNQNNDDRFGAEDWSGATWVDADFIARCNPENIAAILAHVEAQAAEIERLTLACRRAVIALAAATDQMPVFAADYAAVSDALKEQRCKF